MARKPRVHFPGAFYDVIARGAIGVGRSSLPIKTIDSIWVSCGNESSCRALQPGPCSYESGHNEGGAKTYDRHGCSADDDHTRRSSHSQQEEKNTYLIMPDPIYYRSKCTWSLETWPLMISMSIVLQTSLISSRRLMATSPWRTGLRYFVIHTIGQVHSGPA